MTTYTLIAFTEGRDGWYDRCGDYNEGEPSELDIDYYTDPKECGFMWAYQERQYETTKLLIDGKDPYDDGDYGTPEHDARMELWEEAEGYRREQSDLLKAKHDEEQRIKREEEARKKAEAEALQKARTEQREREQLAQLQAKYGGLK